MRIADDVDTLKARRRSITAVFRADVPSVNGLASLPGVVSVDRTGTMLNVGIDGDPAPALAHLEALEPLDLRVAALDLEEIFLQTVRPERAGRGVPS